MKRGFLNPRVVTKISFWTTSGCILVAVVACLLAIWQFTGTDVLWRTVATCAPVFERGGSDARTGERYVRDSAG